MSTPAVPLRFEVAPRPGEAGPVDPRARAIERQAASLGLGLDGLALADLYWVAGLAPDAAERLLREVVVDPVTQVLRGPLPAGTLEDREAPGSSDPFLEVALLPGVTDPVAETLAEAACLLGLAPTPSALRVATGRHLSAPAGTDPRALTRLASGLLVNPIIERHAVGRHLPPAFVEATTSAEPGAALVPVGGLDEAGLLAVSAERRLALDAAEMRSVQASFEALGCEPTELELEMIAQTWSEHCVHKTFRAHISCEEIELDGARKVHEVDGLLKSLLRAATEALARPWVRSAFVDNAGIVALSDTLDVAIKVETHNHPSALEPFGGANTGMGGVIRDVIGVSARPFASLDVLCFGPTELAADALPAGVLHPRRIADGVLHGIEDYGNKMGIPTVAGAILYHPGYLRNPLVFCGTVGVLPHGSHRTGARAGDLVVVLGGRTGRDGLRGATFSSLAMDGGTATVSGGAVQIGHPIAEKQVMEVVLAARDERLYTAITDCGAGGLSSAVGEMGGVIGAEVHLERVPLKYAGLASWEIWLSEAQERMVLAVPPEHLPRLLELAALHHSEATALGVFGHEVDLGAGPEPCIEVRHHGLRVGCLGVRFLDEGLPRRRLAARWQAPPLSFERPIEDLAEGLARRRSSPNLGTREPVVRRYDHEVGGGTVVRPLVGVAGDTPSDAAVLTPLEARERWLADRLENEHLDLPAIALGVGLDPELGLIDPYCMAWACIDEAVRNVVAVGADPDHVAILDNFSWGDPKRPDRLGALVRCVRGCRDAALHYGTPFVSGKDSLNNEWTDADGVRHAIPPTLVITALGRVPDVSDPRVTATSALGAEGDVLYHLGVVNDHPTAFPDAAVVGRYRALHRAFRAGLVRSCHDVSHGGLLLALAEMADGGRLGAEVTLGHLPGAGPLRPDRRAFCEGPGRHLVAVAPADAAAFEALLEGHHAHRVGRVIAARALVVDGQVIVLGATAEAA